MADGQRSRSDRQATWSVWIFCNLLRSFPVSYRSFFVSYTPFLKTRNFVTLPPTSHITLVLATMKRATKLIFEQILNFRQLCKIHKVIHFWPVLRQHRLRDQYLVQPFLKLVNLPRGLNPVKMHHHRTYYLLD